MSLVKDLFVLKRQGKYLHWRNNTGLHLPPKAGDIMWTENPKEAWVLYPKGMQRVLEDLRKHKFTAEVIKVPNSWTPVT